MAMTKEQALALASARLRLQQQQSQAAPQEQPVFDPSAGRQELRPFGIGTGVIMPQGVSRFLTGVGKEMTDVAQGTGQLLGLVDQSAVQEKQRLDAPLMQTGAGKAGAITGGISTALPTMFIPGVNTVTGAALTGGALGLTQPIAEGDVLTGKVKSGATGLALGAAGQKAAQVLTKGAQNLYQAATTKAAAKQSAGAVKDATLREAQQLGYVVSPAATKGSATGKVLAGLSGKAKTEQLARIKNQEVTDRVIKNAIGLTEDVQLTPDVLQGLRNQAYQQGYTPIAQFGKVNADKQLSQKLTQIKQKYAGQSSSFPTAVRKDIVEMLDSLKRVRSFTSDDALNQIKLLRESAKDAFSGAKPDQVLGRSYREAADALEDQLERGIRKSGVNNANDILANFRSARQQIAKTHSVEDALIEGGGTVDAMKLARQLQSGAPLSGDIRKVAAFANNFKESARLPSSADANPLTVLDFTTMGAGGGLTAMGGMGAPLMALPAARVAARYGILSPVGQRMFTQPNYAPGLFNTIPNALTGNVTNALLRTAPLVYAGQQ